MSSIPLIMRRASALALLVVSGLAHAGADSPPGIDLAFEVAPWGLFEFEDTIGPSVGVQGAYEIGGGLGLGGLYRGLGDLGGMAGVFARLASTPVLTKNKPFGMGYLDGRKKPRSTVVE